MKKNEHIKCNVTSCLHNNCEKECCTLDTIKVSCDCPNDEATKEKETICTSFDCGCPKEKGE